MPTASAGPAHGHVPPLVLVVEHHDDTRVMLRTLFSLEGYEVLVAENAESAYGTITQVHPDVILLDGALPGEDGLSLARRLCEEHPSAARRVVFFTGRMTPDLETHVRAAGCDSLHLTPLDFDRLLRTVRRLAGSRSSPG
jgi:DNA-binding response OmpR family regulator